MRLTEYFFYIILPFIVSLWAQWRVKSAFNKYSRVAASSGITGAECAREILNAAGIHDVEVSEVNGFLGDHYDPLHKKLCLSTDVFNTPSVAALGIAAHETGHAIQHAKAYAPLQWRMTAVPLTVVASQILPFVFLGSFILPAFGPLLLKIGIICFLAVAAFQLITLPVEYDASRRAKVILEQMGIIQAGPEAAGVRRVLGAAALTYVAAFVAALGNVLYLLSMTQRRD